MGNSIDVALKTLARVDDMGGGRGSLRALIPQQADARERRTPRGFLRLGIQSVRLLDVFRLPSRMAGCLPLRQLHLERTARMHR